MQIRADNVIREAQKIIENVIIFEPDTLYPKVVTVIFELDSKTDELLKCSFIDLLRTSVKDIVSVGHLLPSVYTFIHDIDSEPVRGAGMKYLVHILEYHHQLVTQTFIETIKIFLKDPVTVVKGRAIEAFGVLMRRFPEQVDGESVNIVLSSILDKYVFIHKTAAKLSYSLYPFLDESKLGTLILNLLQLELVYKSEKDWDFNEDLINILLFVTRNNRKAYKSVVNRNLVALCNCKDYHYESKAIEKLTEITLQDDQFQNLWFINVVRFLTHTFSDRHNEYMDSRKKLFDTFYKIQPKVLTDNITLFNDFIKNRTDQGIFKDIKECYSILAFFNLYEQLDNAAVYFEKTVPHTTSEKYAHDFNTIAGNIARLERVVEAEKIDLNTITILKNEL